MVDDGSARLAPAVKLLQVYGREGDKELLRDFYYQDDRWLDGALLSIEEAGETDVSVLFPWHDSQLMCSSRSLRSGLRYGRMLSRTSHRTRRGHSSTRQVASPWASHRG